MVSLRSIDPLDVDMERYNCSIDFVRYDLNVGNFHRFKSGSWEVRPGS